MTVRPSRCIAFFALVLSSLCAMAQVAYETDFSQPAGRWQSYHRDAPKAALEHDPEGGRNGSGRLRVTCTGRQNLEGAGTTIPVTPWTLYEVSVTLRGEGDAWFCLNSANGWLYSRSTAPLTRSWQTLTLQKLTGARDTRLSIHVLTKAAHPAVFELDAVRVVEQPAPTAQDSAVPRLFLEAEDLVTLAADSVDLPGASGGRAVDLPIYGQLAGIPFPLTTRAVTLFAKVRTGTPGDVFQLNADIGGYAHTLASVKPPEAQGWQWIALPVPVPAAARGTVRLALRQAKRGLPKAQVDCIVLGTGTEPPDATADELQTLASRRPLIAVGRASETPTIDGILDDACWQQGIQIRDFVTNANKTPPSQPTRAQLSYDDQALYVAFRCREYVLQPEANQHHEFRQSQTDHDSAVWKDDSVVVLLQPAGSDRVYDIFANALGTVADASCVPPNLWGTRDQDWNGGIRAAGTIGDGVWTVELAIPFEGLGTAPPDLGSAWRIGLGRIAVHAKETTSWHPVNRGFHELEALGSIAFRQDVPHIDLSIPAQLASGKAKAVCALGNAPGPALASLQIEGAGPRPTVVSRLVEADSEASLPFTVSREGQMRLLPSVLDGATLEPLYLAPPQIRVAKASECRLRLQAQGPYRVFMNGVSVASGTDASPDKPVIIPLQSGVNALSITTETGTLAASLDLPGKDVVTDTTWRMAEGLPEGFAEADYDDSAWPKAVVDGPAGESLAPSGAKILRSDGPGVARRVILFEHTYIWPKPDPAIFVPLNAPQHLTVSTTGIPGRDLAGFELHLLVPELFEIVGATGYYGRTRPDKPQFKVTETGRSASAADGLRHVVVSATAPLPYRPKVRILELANLYVRYRGEEQPDQPAEFTYWTEAENGSVTECPQTFKVAVSPALDGRQPKTLMWQLWGSFFNAMDDPEMKRATFETAAMAGFNNIVAGSAEDAEIGHTFGITNTMGINFEPWCLGRADYLNAHPDAALIDADGKASERYVCTSELLDEGWDDVARQLSARIEEKKADVVDWDYESSPFNSYLSCYCPRCLDAFRRHADLAATTPLTPVVIRDSHADAWIDFLTTRNAQLGAKFNDVAHANDAHFSMYSGYQSDRTRQIYGVDWAKVGELQAADHVGCGYGRRPDRIEATVDALDGIPLVLGILVRPYDRSLQEPVVAITKARALRRQVDSTGGLLVYDRLPLGGRSWFALAEISRLTAEYEDIFLKGAASLDAVSVEPFAEADVAIKHHNGKALIMLMNSSASTKTYTVSATTPVLPNATRFFGKATIGLQQPVVIELQPGDAEAIVVDVAAGQ